MSNPANKYGAIPVFADPNNYKSNRAFKDENHTVRFPSKYEYKVYCGLMGYLIRTNSQYQDQRYFLELQFTITLISKGVMQSAITHVVDFVIRDLHAKSNPILYVEAKGQFLKEYNQKMKMLQAVRPNVHSRYLVVSDNEPPSSYTAYYCPFKKLEHCLYGLGVK